MIRKTKKVCWRPTDCQRKRVALRTAAAIVNSCDVKFRLPVEPDEDGVFVAKCATLPGCISQGKTRDEAMANIRDAIQGYIESLKKHGDPIPATS